MSVEEVQSVGKATPTKVKRDPLELPSVSGLGVPVLSPDMKKVAKQLIEKHTIENVNLENKLRESENAALKKLYAKIEERKSKVGALFCTISTKGPLTTTVQLSLDCANYFRDQLAPE